VRAGIWRLASSADTPIGRAPTPLLAADFSIVRSATPSAPTRSRHVRHQSAVRCARLEVRSCRSLVELRHAPSMAPIPLKAYEFDDRRIRLRRVKERSLATRAAGAQSGDPAFVSFFLLPLALVAPSFRRTRPSSHRLSIAPAGRCVDRRHWRAGVARRVSPSHSHHGPDIRARQEGQPGDALVRAWLRNAKPVSKEWSAQVKPVPIMHPDTDQRIPGTVGTAFDYRLRYYLALTALEDPARLRRVRAMSSFGSDRHTRSGETGRRTRKFRVGIASSITPDKGRRPQLAARPPLSRLSSW